MTQADESQRLHAASEECAEGAHFGPSEQPCLGPFDPPADYAFEPELVGPAPRPLTPRVQCSPLERRRKWAGRGILAFGIASLAACELPQFRQWAIVVPSLAYLNWVGAGAIGLWGVGMVVGWLGLGPQCYVRRGIPLVARVVDLVKAPVLIMNGQAALYGFTAIIEFLDPKTNELQRRSLASPQFSAGHKNQTTTSFKVGDYVTAVYLPGKYPKSLQLFAFLELVPELGIVRRQKPVAKNALWNASLIAITVVAFFAVALWNLYAITCLHSVGFDYTNAILPMVAGGIPAAVLFLGGTWRGHRREQRRIAERNAQALASGEAVEFGSASFWGQRGLYGFVIKALLIPGIFLVGGMTVLCWCFTANAWLDDSPATLQAATVEGFQGRKLFYRLPGVPDRLEYYTTRENCLKLLNKPAVAEVHAGRLGWPWVKELRAAGPGN
ncbi:MAG TPA: hypothetical protein VMV10_28275 [Pirellulales bacterium]|nr:hypothetical protein [Pirellulales bacterium]